LLHIYIVFSSVCVDFVVLKCWSFYKFLLQILIVYIHNDPCYDFTMLNGSHDCDLPF